MGDSVDSGRTIRQSAGSDLIMTQLLAIYWVCR